MRAPSQECQARSSRFQGGRWCRLGGALRGFFRCILNNGNPSQWLMGFASKDIIGCRGQQEMAPRHVRRHLGPRGAGAGRPTHPLPSGCAACKRRVAIRVPPRRRDGADVASRRAVRCCTAGIPRAMPYDYHDHFENCLSTKLIAPPCYSATILAD